MDFIKIGQKGGIQFFFNKGRDRKKGRDGVIRGGGIKKIYKTFLISLKETQTFKAYWLNPTNTALLLQEATQKHRKLTD